MVSGTFLPIDLARERGKEPVVGYILDELPKNTASPAAQEHFARLTDRRKLLYRNEHLTDAVFADLLGQAKPRIPISDAKELVTRNVLTDAQFDTLLTVESRASVIQTYVSRYRQPRERLDAILGCKALSRSLSDSIISDYSEILDLEWFRTAADKVGGRARLELWLRAPQEFSDDAISAALEPFAGLTFDRGLIVQLLADRPGVIAGAARSANPKVRTAAAGCRHLTAVRDQLACVDLTDVEPGHIQPTKWIVDRGYSMMALANNPVVGNEVVRRVAEQLEQHPDYDFQHSAERRLARHPEPVTALFEEETDKSKIGWLLTRSLPSDNKPEGRYFDLLAVLSNSNLSEGEVARALQKIAAYGSGHEAVDALEAHLARFPDLGSVPPEARPSVRPPDAPEERSEPWGPVDESTPTMPVHHLANNGPALRYVEQELDQSPAAWATALSLLDTGFTGSVGDLVLVVKATLA